MRNVLEYTDGLRRQVATLAALRPAMHALTELAGAADAKLQDLKDAAAAGDAAPSVAKEDLEQLEAQMRAVVEEVRGNTVFYSSVEDGFGQQAASRAHREQVQTRLAVQEAAALQAKVKGLVQSERRLLREVRECREERAALDARLQQVEAQAAQAQAAATEGAARVAELEAAAVVRPAWRRAAGETDYDAAIEARDQQVRALEVALQEESDVKAQLAARVRALAVERVGAQEAVRSFLMSHDFVGRGLEQWERSLSASLPATFWDLSDEHVCDVGPGADTHVRLRVCEAALGAMCCRVLATACMPASFVCTVRSRGCVSVGDWAGENAREIVRARGGAAVGGWRGGEKWVSLGCMSVCLRVRVSTGCVGALVCLGVCARARLTHVRLRASDTCAHTHKCLHAYQPYMHIHKHSQTCTTHTHDIHWQRHHSTHHNPVLYV